MPAPRPYSLYEPQGLALPACLDHKHQLHARLLVSLVLGRFAFRRQDEQGFVRLKAKYLYKYIPASTLKAVRSALVRAGILVMDSFIQGVRSFGFKLGDEWTGRPIVRYDCQCPRLSAKLRRLRRRSDKLPRGAIYRHLVGMFGRLKVDMPRVLSVCEGLGRPELAIVAHEILSGQSPYIVCPYGRLHSPLTRLKREIRPCLSVEGQELVNIDIVNSQPMFLAMQMTNRNENKENGKEEKGKRREGREEAITIQHLSHGHAGYEDRSPLTCDQREYVALCESGTLYEALGEMWGLSRPKTKKMMYRIIMGRNKRIDRYARAFMDRFPNVWSHIREVKKKDYKHMSHMLQRDESRLVINGVCDAIRRLDPSIPLYTIHDSIMTTPQHIDLVHAVMLERFAELGLAPRLKVEGLPEAPGGPSGPSGLAG